MKATTTPALREVFFSLKKQYEANLTSPAEESQMWNVYSELWSRGKGRCVGMKIEKR